jgi:hypothetical protein
MTMRTRKTTKEKTPTVVMKKKNEKGNHNQGRKIFRP